MDYPGLHVLDNDGRVWRLHYVPELGKVAEDVADDGGPIPPGTKAAVDALAVPTLHWQRIGPRCSSAVPYTTN